MDICMPKACSASDLKKIFGKIAISNAKIKNNFSIDSACKSKKKMPLDSKQYL